MMEDTYSPAVLTSRLAQRDIEDIKGAHSDLLKGMALQSTKVQQFNQNKAMEEREKNTLTDKVRKDNQDAILKQQELDIKRISTLL